MSMPSASLMVGLFDRCVCIKVSGKASFACGMDLKTVVGRLSTQGYDHFALDLRECPMMDSTFLGVLSGVGLQFVTPSNQVCLVNPPPRIRELLDGLGVSHLFRFLEKEPATEAGFTPVCKEEPTRVEITRTCLEAHKLLMALNPENVCRFKDVALFLAEDLKKQEAAEKNGAATNGTVPHA
jgi:anti-sigma B factor antagonist